jgi:hypothetical protein
VELAMQSYCRAKRDGVRQICQEQIWTHEVRPEGVEHRMCEINPSPPAKIKDRHLAAFNFARDRGIEPKGDFVFCNFNFVHSEN